MKPLSPFLQLHNDHASCYASKGKESRNPSYRLGREGEDKEITSIRLGVMAPKLYQTLLQ
jgi:hypothetical protein